MFGLLSADDRPAGMYSYKIQNYILYLDSVGLSLYDDLVYIFKLHFIDATKDKHNQSELSMFMHYVYMQLKYYLFKNIRKANQIIIRNLDSYQSSDYTSTKLDYYLFKYTDKKYLTSIYSDPYLVYLFNLIVENPSLHKRAKILNIAPATLKKRKNLYGNH